MATLTLQVDNAGAKKAIPDSKCCELDKAIQDVKKGNVMNFDTLENMMNYLEA